MNDATSKDAPRPQVQKHPACKEAEHPMITALCGQAGGITKSGKPCRIRVSDSGRLCMAHDPQHRKNGLLAEDGDRNVTQTITDGIIKGIGDGPDPGHHEAGRAQSLHPDATT